jgi:glycosyltransferase involved in cell wall biosynthesis
MYHADLIGGLAARSVGIPVVWGLHHSDLDSRTSGRRTMWVQRLCAWLSHLVPARIVSCSQTGLRVHQAIGYDAERLTWIPNGFALDRFAPSAEHRATVRGELGIAAEAPVVGVIGRFHPAKDHPTFLRAAAIVARAEPATQFVLAGVEMDEDNPLLFGLRRELGLEGHVHLLGRRSDVERIDAALDVLCSSSLTEGFSLVIGEAMACAVPCVVTDVGDSASIVGDTGAVVAPGNPDALAEAILRIVRMPAPARAELGAAARRRVQEKFELREVTRRYEELHASLVRV